MHTKNLNQKNQHEERKGKFMHRCVVAGFMDDPNNMASFRVCVCAKCKIYVCIWKTEVTLIYHTP